MSEEQFHAFQAAMSADPSLRERVNGAADLEGVLAVAKAAGFTFAIEHLMEHVQDLSDEELDSVAGGFTQKKCWKYSWG